VSLRPLPFRHLSSLPPSFLFLFLFFLFPLLNHILFHITYSQSSIINDKNHMNTFTGHTQPHES
jgi:hypothetical protein